MKKKLAHPKIRLKVIAKIIILCSYCKHRIITETNNPKSDTLSKIRFAWPYKTLNGSTVYLRYSDKVLNEFKALLSHEWRKEWRW